jgi:hypothetical protein
MWLDQPHEIALETQALCNAACTMCPYPDIERKGQKMPDKLIARLVDEMAQWRIPFAFAPFKMSDPLLDKRLIPLLETICERTVGTPRVFTNGSALTDKNIAGLAGLKRLDFSVSLNAHDPAEYEAIMALKFDRTAARLDALHASEFPHAVTLTRVGVDAGFAGYVKERWPKFTPFEIKRDGWLGYTHAAVSEVPTTACGRWWELSIMANGIASLCCMDGRGEYPIGDVNKQTLLEIYNAPGWRERRVRNISRHDVPVCNQCTY